MNATDPLAVAHPGIPLMARRLGNAGLIPFVLGALLVHIVWPDAHPYVTLALAAYGACILSFLGGIHWGAYFLRHAQHESVDDRWLIWGVVPSLVAWLAIIMPPSAGLVVEGVMLAVCYLVDRRTYPVQGLSEWLTLRFRLSLIASFSCFLGAAGT